MQCFTRLLAVLTLTLLPASAWAAPFHFFVHGRFGATPFNGAFFSRVRPTVPNLPSQNFTHNLSFTNNTSFSSTPGANPFRPSVQFSHNRQVTDNVSFAFTPSTRFPFRPTETATNHLAVTNNISFAFTPGARFAGVPAEHFTHDLTFNTNQSFRLTPNGSSFIPTTQLNNTTNLTNNVSFNGRAPVFVPNEVSLVALRRIPTLRLDFSSGSFNSPAVPIANEIRNVASTGYYTNLGLQRASFLNNSTPYNYPYSPFLNATTYPTFPSYLTPYVGSPYRGYGYGYPYGGYGYGSPYGGYGAYNPWLSGMGGYGYGGGGYGGGGGGGGGGGYVGPGMGGEGGIEAPMPAQKGDSPTLEALGLPNAGGRLEWPLGFRLLPRTSDARVWQQQVDTLLPAAVTQASDGQLNPQTVTEIKRSLDNLADLLHSRTGNMPASAAAEADRFLQQVNASLKMLR